MLEREGHSNSITEEASKAKKELLSLKTDKEKFEK
jgi:hypothetical protein